MSAMKNYIEIPLNKLVSAEWNYKKIDDDQSLALMEKLKKNLARNGQVENIIVRKMDKGKFEVVNGNHRLKALGSIGVKSVVCFNLGKITLAHAQRIAVETNETNFEKDPTKMAHMLKSITAEFSVDDLIETMPMDKSDIDGYLGSLEFDSGGGKTDPDSVPDIKKNLHKVKMGDIWTLGPHRLMCGDSTDKIQLGKLMGGKKADLVFTSPPYALGKSSVLNGNKRTSQNKSVYTTHDDNPEHWLKLMNGWFSASEKFVGDCWLINIQMLAGNKRDLVNFIDGVSERLVDIVTWDKGHAAPAMAPGVMSSRFEWILVLGKINATRTLPYSSWRGTVANVYSGPPQRNNEFASTHGATMPIHLPEWSLGVLCDKSKSVYEPFCGTGTTIIACENTGRKCFGMEIDPHYCSLSIERWQQFTGKKAKRL